MKYLLILLISISNNAFAQETNSEWDYDEESFNEEVKASLNFINTERVDDLLIKKKRRSSNKVNVFRIQLYSGNRSGHLKQKIDLKSCIQMFLLRHLTSNRILKPK